MSDDAIPAHLETALDALAENPALPAAMVRRLLARQTGLGEVAARPDLTDDMIAEIIAAGDRWLVHELALNPRLPDKFRMCLAAHPDPGVRAALVVNAAGAPREMFEKLINDPAPRVREYLAQKDHVPADLRARLAADESPGIRAALAQWWPQAPEHVRRALLTDTDQTVRAAACSTYYRRLPHPVPPADLLPALLQDPATRAGAVIHAVLDTDIADKLLQDEDSKVRAELARHPDLPTAIRDILAADPSPKVRISVFARPDTPEPMRAAIFTGIHEHAGSLDDLDLYLDADDDLLEQQIENALATTELRTLRLAWVSADPAPHIDSPYVCFRVSAAAGTSLPATAVARLLDDEDNLVRITAAKTHRHLVDPATAERIERRHQPGKFTTWWDDEQVLSFPAETLRRFATDPEPRIRSLAQRDPDLPSELAAKLAADPDESVRCAIATHPSLPTQALIRLLHDQSERVAHAAAGSASLPVSEMERLLTLAGL